MTACGSPCSAFSTAAAAPSKSACLVRAFSEGGLRLLLLHRLLEAPKQDSKRPRSGGDADGDTDMKAASSGSGSGSGAVVVKVESKSDADGDAVMNASSAGSAGAAAAAAAAVKLEDDPQTEEGKYVSRTNLQLLLRIWGRRLMRSCFSHPCTGCARGCRRRCISRSNRARRSLAAPAASGDFDSLFVIALHDLSVAGSSWPLICLLLSFCAARTLCR